MPGEKKKPGGTKVGYRMMHIQLPLELANSFRAFCVLRDITVSKKIESLVRIALREVKK